ncbi:MAG: helix-turn-helix domain-containing protein [Phycisphaeraceae bacterium]
MLHKPKPATEQLVEAIAEARRQGITKYRIARDAQLSEANVGRIAAGKTVPQIDTAERILHAIGGKLTIEAPRDRKA